MKIINLSHYRKKVIVPSIQEQRLIRERVIEQVIEDMFEFEHPIAITYAKTSAKYVIRTGGNFEKAVDAACEAVKKFQDKRVRIL